MLHGILGNLTVMSRRLRPPRTIRSTPLPLCFVFLHTTRFSPHFFDFRSLCAHRSRIPSAPTLGYAYVRVQPLRDQVPHRGSTAYRLTTDRDDPGSNPGGDPGAQCAKALGGRVVINCSITKACFATHAFRIYATFTPFLPRLSPWLNGVSPHHQS